MTTTRGNDRGFTLVEVLLVLGILSILSVIMVYSMTGARQIGMSNQALAMAQQNARLVTAIVERDLRQTGGGLFVNSYRVKNGGKAGEVTGSMNPDSFDYDLGTEDLEGMMVPPIEVINGTDGDGSSYLNPAAESIGLTAQYREPGTDMVTIYTLVNSGFTGTVDDVTGGGQENFLVTDSVIGARVKDIFDASGGKPVLVIVMDDEGTYATLRTITEISEQSGEYRMKMEPSNDTNQPSNFKAFLEELGYEFNGPGGPELLRQTINGDSFAQVSAVSYFVYTHPDPGRGARGWLVRLDLPVMVAGELDIDATDPDTIRPFVLAEHVVDFQVALGIDADDDGLLSAAEWINDETMETYSHLTVGEDSVNAEFLSLVNDFREMRFSIVTHTDNSTVENPFGFGNRDDASFYTKYPTVIDVANAVGIAPQLEDRIWNYSEMIDRLWYRRGVQLTRSIKIRNLDLENMFARRQ